MYRLCILISVCMLFQTNYTSSPSKNTIRKRSSTLQQLITKVTPSRKQTPSSQNTSLPFISAIKMLQSSDQAQQTAGLQQLQKQAASICNHLDAEKLYRLNIPRCIADKNKTPGIHGDAINVYSSNIIDLLNMPHNCIAMICLYNYNTLSQNNDIPLLTHSERESYEINTKIAVHAGNKAPNIQQVQTREAHSIAHQRNPYPEYTTTLLNYIYNNQSDHLYTKPHLGKHPSHGWNYHVIRGLYNNTTMVQDQQEYGKHIKYILKHHTN